MTIQATTRTQSIGSGGTADLPPSFGNAVGGSESLEVIVRGAGELAVTDPEGVLHPLAADESIDVGIEATLPDDLGDQGGTSRVDLHGRISID
jgi:hypothetical protein